MIKSVLSNKITLISSGKPLSKSLSAYFQKKNYLNMDKNPTTQFYVSDSSDKFKELGSRFLNDAINSIEICEL
jgi:glutamate racemase